MSRARLSLPSRFSLRILAVALLLAAAPAAAQGVLGPGAITSGGSKEEPFPLHGTASFTTSIGQGTFVPGPTNNPQLLTSLTLQPTVVYRGFVGFISQSYQLEWTESDLTTTKNQFEMWDTSIGLRYQGFRLPDYGVTFSVGGGAQLPLSMLSRQAGALGTLQLAGRVTYFNAATGILAYGGGAAGHTLLVPELSQRFRNQPVKQTDDAVTSSCLVRNINELNNYACARVPAQDFWRVGTGGSWSGFDGTLVVSLDLGYQQLYSAFRVMERDALTADAARTGLVPTQFTTSNMSATWVAQPWMFLTVGAQTFMPTWSADNKRLRFPLWDFESMRENSSQIYFDVTFVQ